MQSYLKDAVDISKVQRVLVVKFRHLGDVLLTSPVFSALKALSPQIQVDALVYADTKCMLQEHPEVDQIHVVDRTWKSQPWRARFAHEKQLTTDLQARTFDLVINLSDNNRAARLVRRLKPRISVSQAYPHRKGRWWKNSFTHIYSIPQKPRHTVELHLDALRRLGWQLQEQDKRLQMGISEAATLKLEQLRQTKNLPAKQFIVIHPASRWMFKGWNVAGFVGVIDQLSKHYAIAMTSGPDQAERELVKAILAKTDVPVANFSGQLNLDEFAALLSQAACFIGVDSVPMHMAAALSVPTVALFGPSNDQVWGPWMVKHQLVMSDVTCRPCDLDGCGNSKVSDCLQTITADTVVEKTKQLLAH